jgi:preprotein translocase subunit YajC
MIQHGDGLVAHWWATRCGSHSGPLPKHKTNRKVVAVMNQTVVFLPLLIVLGAFMFFASRRQKRAMQATIDLHESLRIGDRVHTTSGLQGTITHITDDTVDLEIAPGVVTTWIKLAIRDRIEPEILDTGAEEADGLAEDPERLPKD